MVKMDLSDLTDHAFFTAVHRVSPPQRTTVKMSDRSELLEDYLDKKNEVIIPALQELADDFRYKNYTVTLNEGGVDRDILIKELPEESRKHISRTHLLGQVAFKIVNKQNMLATVIFGYVGGNVEVVDPGTEGSEKIPVTDLSKDIVKKLVRKKLAASLSGDSG